MGIIRIFRLYRACFDLAGAQGFISFTQYLCVALCTIVYSQKVIYLHPLRFQYFSRYVIFTFSIFLLEVIHL